MLTIWCFGLGLSLLKDFFLSEEREDKEEENATDKENAEEREIEESELRVQ